MQRHEAKARFIPPMLLQRVSWLPEGPEWSYEIKLDGCRELAIKANGKILLRSRNNKDFNSKYPGVAKALGALPDETVIDGEIVARTTPGGHHLMLCKVRARLSCQSSIFRRSHAARRRARAQ